MSHFSEMAYLPLFSIAGLFVPNQQASRGGVKNFSEQQIVIAARAAILAILGRVKNFSGQ